MADADLLDSLEEIDAATERARECSDHLWRLASDRSVAADYAFELCQALRRVQDEAAGMRIAMAGVGSTDVTQENSHERVGHADLTDRIDRAGGRVVLPFPGGDVEVTP